MIHRCQFAHCSSALLSHIIRQCLKVESRVSCWSSNFWSKLRIFIFYRTIIFLIKLFWQRRIVNPGRMNQIEKYLWNCCFRIASVPQHPWTTYYIWYRVGPEKHSVSRSTLYLQADSFQSWQCCLDPNSTEVLDEGNSWREMSMTKTTKEN
jgi:hypothetical protein